MAETTTKQAALAASTAGESIQHVEVQAETGNGGGEKAKIKSPEPEPEPAAVDKANDSAESTTEGGSPPLPAPGLAASPWTFSPRDIQLQSFYGKEIQEHLEKWGLKHWSYAKQFQFAGPWDSGKNADSFITAFLNSSAGQVRELAVGSLDMSFAFFHFVHGELNVFFRLCSVSLFLYVHTCLVMLSIRWESVDALQLQVATREKLTPFFGRVEAIDVLSLRATVTNMNFFDRLTDEDREIVRKSGHVYRMFVV